jgi:CBS domain-containing protein
LAPSAKSNADRRRESLPWVTGPHYVARVQVQEAMSNRFARIRAGSTMFQAAETVALAGSSDLMVIDEDGGFVGVLSEGDILRAALPDVEEMLEAGGSLDVAFARFVEKAHDLSTLPIAPLIIRNPITVAPDDHVTRAVVVLVERGIRLLPVVSAGRLLGVISRADVCNAVVGQLTGLSVGVA